MSQAPGAPRAVFVDASGRRHRVAHWAAVAGGLVCGVYLLLVLAALVVPAGALRVSVPGIGPLLPGPGAPRLTTGRAGRAASPRQVLLAPTRSPEATAASPAGTAAATAPAASRPAVLPTPTPTASRAHRSGPTAIGRPTPQASAAPTRAATPVATAPPGATPSPKATGRPTARPSHSPNAHSMKGTGSG